MDYLYDNAPIHSCLFSMFLFKDQLTNILPANFSKKPTLDSTHHPNNYSAPFSHCDTRYKSNLNLGLITRAHRIGSSYKNVAENIEEKTAN